MDPFQTFSAGDKLKISADYHTLTVKMLQWWMNTQRGDMKPARTPHSREMRPRIKNVSGDILNQFGIVAYQNNVGDKLVFPAHADTYSFGDIVKESQAPAVGVPFAIMQEPATVDGLAVVKVSGDSLVLVSMATSADAYAGPIAADYAKLLGDPISGPARILDHRAPDAYSDVTAYVIGDSVSKSGTYYTCIANTTGNTPPNATYWTARATCWALIRLADPTGEHDTYFALSSTTITARSGFKLGKGVATLLTLLPDGGDEDWIPTTQTVTVYNACDLIAVNTFLQLFREPISGKLMAVPLCVESEESCPCEALCLQVSFPGVTNGPGGFGVCTTCDQFTDVIELARDFLTGPCLWDTTISACSEEIGFNSWTIVLTYLGSNDWLLYVQDFELKRITYRVNQVWDCVTGDLVLDLVSDGGSTTWCKDWPATITVSPCDGSGSGGGEDCCDGVCEDGNVSSTLTATVTDKVGCFTDLASTLNFGCVSVAGTTHYWQAPPLTLSVCDMSNDAYPVITCVDGVPQLYFADGDPVFPTLAEAGFTCYPFSAVFLVDDGGGNTCTITVVG